MNSIRYNLKHPLRGFTLIEMMVVVVIIGVLAAIAMPAYNQYVERTNLADAKQAITGIRQGLEAAKLAKPADFRDAGQIETYVEGRISQLPSKLTSKYSYDKEVVAQGRVIHTYFHAVPVSLEGKRYYLWGDQSGNVLRCLLNGSAPSSVSTTKPSNDCESF